MKDWRPIPMKRSERSRLAYINRIERDYKVTHCYIVKGGYYYRENSCGYTEYREAAGIYSKDEAIKICRACSIEVPIPINISEHNNMILTRIKELTHFDFFKPNRRHETIKSTAGGSR